MKPIPLITGTAVPAPRWLPGVRHVFAAPAYGPNVPPGTVPMWCETGSSPPFILSTGWVKPLSPDLASDDRVETVLQRIAASGCPAIAWDFEHLDWADERTTRLHLKLIKRLRELAPAMLQSVYDVPGSVYWPFVNKEADGIAALRARNDRLTYGMASTGRRYPDRGLIPACDFGSVSLYLHYPDRREMGAGMTQRDYLARDAAFLHGNLDEARRVMGDKPIVGWLMPKVHETGEPLIDERIDQALRIIASHGAHACFFEAASRPGVFERALAIAADASV